MNVHCFLFSIKYNFHLNAAYSFKIILYFIKLDNVSSHPSPSTTVEEMAPPKSLMDTYESNWWGPMGWVWPKMQGAMTHNGLEF